MRKLLVIVFLGTFFLQGYSQSLVEQEIVEEEITKREKEQQMVSTIQEDFFINSVIFDEESKTFHITSDYHIRAATIAKRGEGLQMRNGQTMSWDDYITHHVNSYFKDGGNGSSFFFGIGSVLGSGYTVKEKTSYGEVIFIAKDGVIIYDIINGYAI